jgi:hypothetical protein
MTHDGSQAVEAHDRLAAIWRACSPLDRLAVRPIAEWCARLMHVSLADLPSLPALRAGDSSLLDVGGLAAGLCLVGAMVSPARSGVSGLLVLQEGEIAPHVLGAPDGVVPLIAGAANQSGGRRRDDAAVIVAGLGNALALAGGGKASTHKGRLLAVAGIGSLLELELPMEIRRVVLIAKIDDPSFADDTILQMAADRLQHQGKRVGISYLLNNVDRW